MGKIDVSIMSDKEREIYLKRVLMESAVFNEQIEQARKNGKDLVYGENFGMLSLKEFISMHPEYSKHVDQSVWDKSEGETGIYIAPFGKEKFIAINDNIIAGRSENGEFKPSEQLLGEMSKVPMQQMLLLTHSGLANEQYLENYRDNFEKKSMEMNRIPDSFDDYLKAASSEQLMVSEEEFFNKIEISDADRAELEEYKKSIGIDAEEKEEEDRDKSEDEELEREEDVESDEELEEEELEEGEERERGEDEETEEEDREEEEKDAEEKTEEKIAKETVEEDKLIEDIDKSSEKYKDVDMDKLYEERAKILAESVLARFAVPADARAQLVELFMSNPNLDLSSLKQAMEVTIPGVDRDDRGFALRFASKDAGLKDRIVVFDGKNTIDDRKNDSEISAKMDQEYEKAPVEVLGKQKQVLVYTDYSGNTITAPLKNKNMDELTRTEGEKVIREFEELLAKERSLIANRSSMTPENFSHEMTVLSTMRLRVIGENGLNVPEIHDEIKADEEISKEIEEEQKEEKKPEDTKDDKEDEEDKEDDDWVRGSNLKPWM